MFWQASAACASCGASVLVRPLPGLTATRLACTAGQGLGRGTARGLGRSSTDLSGGTLFVCLSGLAVHFKIRILPHL